MSWRAHNTHKEETKAVKDALKEAGINAMVGHGKGTAYGWLEINIGNGNGHLYKQTLAIAQKVTGRRGEYDGNILILTQNHWDKKKGCSVPILQNNL